jgi:N utilization substance protein A
VLIDFGLGEKLAEKLIESGVGTVEKLGSMTPEDLEEIQGIGPKMVEKIQLAVNAYYGQFEAGPEAEGNGEMEPVAEGEGNAVAEAATETPIEAQEAVESETENAAGESSDTADPVSTESDTMKDHQSSAQAPDEKDEVHES